MAESFVEKELAENGAYILKTAGTSMRPLFKAGRDTVIVEKVAAPLKKYDVALYRGGEGRYILHRVIAVREGYYIIRGDNTFVKEMVSFDDVVGVLVSFRRGDKLSSVNDFGYKVYSRFWNFIYPVRAFLHNFRIFLGKIRRKVFRKKGNS